ncbi:MAG: hypothetical protein V1728_06695 [Candidatus Micrarchaeota archaeon]
MDSRGMEGQGFKDRPKKARTNEPSTASFKQVPAASASLEQKNNPDGSQYDPADIYSLIRNQPIKKTYEAGKLVIKGPEAFSPFPSDYLGTGGVVDKQNQEPIWQKKAELEYLENVKAGTINGEFSPANRTQFVSYLAAYAKSISEYVLPPEWVESMPDRPLKWDIVRMGAMTRKVWADKFATLETFYSGSLEYNELPNGMFSGDPGLTSSVSLAPKRHYIEADEITLGIDANGNPFALVDPDAYYAVRKKNAQWFENAQVCVDMPENAVIIATGKRENGRFVWRMKEMDPQNPDFEFAKAPKDGQGSLRLGDLRAFYSQLALQTHYEESEKFEKFALQCGWVGAQNVGKLGSVESTQMLLAEALLFESPPWGSIGPEESRRMSANMKTNTSLFFDYSTGSIRPRTLLFARREDGEVYVVDATAKKRGRGKNEEEALKDLANSGFAGAGMYYFFSKKANAPGTDAMEIVSKPAPDAVWNAMLDKASYLSMFMLVPYTFTLGPFALGLYTFALGAGGFLAGSVEREAEKISRLFHCGKNAGQKIGDDLWTAIDAVFLASLVAGGTAYALEKTAVAGASELVKTWRFGTKLVERAGYYGSIGGMAAGQTWARLQEDADRKLPSLGVAANEPLLKQEEMPMPTKEYAPSQGAQKTNDTIALAYWQYIVPTYLWCKTIDANGKAIERIEKDNPPIARQLASLRTYEKKWRYLADYQPKLYEQAFRQAAGEDADTLLVEMRRDPYRNGARVMTDADRKDKSLVKIANEAVAWNQEIGETLLGQIQIHVTETEALDTVVRMACTRSVWALKNLEALRAYSDFSHFTLASTFKQILMHGGPLNEPGTQGISDGKRLGELMDALNNHAITASQMEELNEIVQTDWSEAFGQMLGSIRNAPDDCFTLAARYYMKQAGQYGDVDLGRALRRLDNGQVGAQGFEREIEKGVRKGAAELDETAQKYAKGLRNLWINGQITTSEILSAANAQKTGARGRQD